MKSLRDNLTKKINKKHRDLVKRESSGDKLWNLLSDKKNWLFILILTVVLALLLSLPGPQFLSLIRLDGDAAKLLIESRITTIVTIISMTLAVTGLLLSNLAIKHNLTYELMFRKSGLYLIIYFALSTISLLIGVSMLRNTLDQELFGRLVLAAGYMCLLVIFGIGFLFRSIINFTTPKAIELNLKHSLLNEFKSNLCYDLFKRYSLIEIEKIMDSANVEKISVMKYLLDSSKNTNSELYIYDIRIDRLKRLIKNIKNPADHNYFPIGINMVSRYHNSFISNLDSPNKLAECLVIKDPKLNKGKSSQYHKYFGDKLEEYSKEKKHEKAAEILDIFLEMHRLTYKHDVK